MTEKEMIKFAKQSYISEINDNVLYLTLAEREKDEYLKENLIRIAKMEEKHANFWKHFLEVRNEEVPKPTISYKKIKFASFLQNFLNPAIIVSFLELGESNAVKAYYQFLKESQLDEHEAKALKNIILDELGHESFFKEESENVGISNVRDFVLGMNDGLVEILGAVTGLSAVYVSNPLIVGVSGLIVGIAGALSMGIGAFISVRSQRQVNEAEKEKLQIIFDIAPEKAVETFKEKLKESDIPEEVAEEVAEKLGENKSVLSKLLIKDDNENEIRSGLFTGFAYLFGVFFPVIPYFIFPSSLIALPFSILFAGLALSIVALFIALISGLSIKKKVMEMVVSGFSAAGIAYLFGKLMQSIFGVEI